MIARRMIKEKEIQGYIIENGDIVIIDLSCSKLPMIIIDKQKKATLVDVKKPFSAQEITKLITGSKEL